MIPAAARRLNPQLVFLALAVSINLLVMFVARHADPSRLRSVTVGAVLDMTVTVPALYYFLVVRRGSGTLASLAVIALLSLWRASFAFPGVVPGRVWIGAALECFAIAAIVTGIRQARRAKTDSDPASRIRAAARGILPFSFASHMLAGELTVLYYGLAWRAKPHIAEGSRAFTLHRRSGIHDILLFTGLASLLEILPVHLVLAHWSTTAAWIATSLSLYGAFWLAALSRSFELRPTLVSSSEILLRLGLMSELRIPVSAIGAISKNIPADALTLPRRTTPELYMEFTYPLQLEKALGMRRNVTGIAVSADDSAGFEEAVFSSVYR
jgi:hypothetical protein